MITTIIFDVGGVFVRGPFDNFLKKVSEIVGFEIKKDSSFREIAGDWMRGKYTFKEFIEKITGTAISEENNKKIFGLWIKNWELDFDMVVFAKKLRPKYKLVILSNADREGIENSGRDNRLDFFDQKFHSFDLGMVKPDMEIYEYVLKELNAKSEECVFIDDKAENIEAAEKLGIHGIVFENKEQLKQDLEELGVTVG
ncbi:MAG: HAD family phosphatase [Candidatus Aenigmarchaeota archaeon]|nr:HAD family phosphatase [Candidatus Aenigmarchaeota archaeon]